jgi:hypothetical protein
MTRFLFALALVLFAVSTVDAACGRAGFFARARERTVTRERHVERGGLFHLRGGAGCSGVIVGGGCTGAPKGCAGSVPGGTYFPSAPGWGAPVPMKK